jgi:hypothetical protein
MVIESDARLGTKTGYKAAVGDRPARAPCASPMKDERIAQMSKFPSVAMMRIHAR